jgi:two-component system sensor histidine kinase AgrC
MPTLNICTFHEENLMPFTRWECLLYSIVSLVPFIFLLYYTFKDRFRFSISRTLLILIPFTLVHIVIHFAALYGYLQWIGFADILLPALYVLLLLIIVRDHIGRVLFALLVVCNFRNLAVSAAKYVEGVFSEADALKRYHWTFSVWLLLFECAILMFLWKVIFKAFRTIDLPDSLERNSRHRLPEGRSLWRYLWFVPATFYLIWMYMFYQGNEPAVRKLMHLHYLLIVIAVDFGSLFIYGLILQLIHDQEEKLELRSENYQLSLQTIQYQYINDRIEQTRRMRHDLRHFLSTTEMLANSGEWEQLRRFISDAKESSDLGEPLFFCKNTAVNAVLSYYYPKMKSCGIASDIHVDIPKEPGVTSSDLSILLSNLTENAVEACSHQAATARSLSIHAAMRGENVLMLTVSNSYEIEPQKNARGVFLSSKHQGLGIGLESVRAIVEKYKGRCSIEAKDKKFTVRIMLLTS